MTKSEYIDNFVVTFISVMTAKNYEDYCSRGLHKELENPPFEDAFFLAEKTWDRFIEHRDAK